MKGAHVLVVHDDASIRSTLVDALTAEGFRTSEAANGQGAVDVIGDDRPAVVLLASQGSGLDGSDILEWLRSHESTKLLPVIMITGRDEVDGNVQYLADGADDYITASVEPDELIARVRARLRGVDAWHQAVNRRWDQRADVVTSIAQIARDPTNDEPATAICEALLQMPSVDGAALLAFRNDDVDVLAEAGLRDWISTRPLPRELALRIIRRCDEGPWTDDLGLGAKRRRRTLPAAFAPLIRSGVVIGALILLRDPHSTSAEPTGQLLSIAVDVAPAVAEVAAVRLLGPSDTVVRRAELEALLARNGFVTVFQPIVHLGERRIVGFEALTRFDDERPPELWFSEAAELGLAAPLERATLQVAAATASHLPAGTYVSINVSAATLQGPEDVHLLPDLACRPIVLELTEHDAVDDYEAVRQTIRSLADVSLAVDDAGAGYSSLSHILALRPDFIKLDKTWVRDVPTDTVRQALVSGLVHFSTASNAALIAEGIETEDEARVLADLGVTFGQGFLFGAAAPAEAWKP